MIKIKDKKRFIIAVVSAILISIVLSLLLYQLITFIQHRLFNNSTVETIYAPIETSLDEKLPYTIVIMAGHGGIDNGTTSPFSGVNEKDLNLEVSKRLERLFNENNFPVAMVRTEDSLLTKEKSTDLEVRKNIIAKNKTGVSLSIHMNSYDKSADISGPEVYYYPNDTVGQALATSIQTQLNTQLNPPNVRTIAEKNFYVLQEASVGSVMVECGFLTNKAEEELLRSSSYQEKLAKAIYDGVITYLEATYNTTIAE